MVLVVVLCADGFFVVAMKAASPLHMFTNRQCSGRQRVGRPRHTRHRRLGRRFVVGVVLVIVVERKTHAVLFVVGRHSGGNGLLEQAGRAIGLSVLRQRAGRGGRLKEPLGGAGGQKVRGRVSRGRFACVDRMGLGRVFVEVMVVVLVVWLRRVMRLGGG